MGTQLSSRPQASCLMESGERRPQAPASGHHGNEAWNATVLAFLPAHLDSEFCCFKAMPTEGGTWGTSPFPPFTVAFPRTKKQKNKAKQKNQNPQINKKPCMFERNYRQFGCNLRATFLGSGFLFRDLFTSCKSLAALTLNWMTFHVFVELLLHQFWFLFLYNFIIILRSCLPTLAPLPHP